MPSPNKRTVLINEGLHKELKFLSAETGMTITSLVEEAIANYIEAFNATLEEEEEERAGSEPGPSAQAYS